MSTPLRIPVPTKVTRNTDLRIASVIDESWYHDYIKTKADLMPEPKLAKFSPRHEVLTNVASVYDTILGYALAVVLLVGMVVAMCSLSGTSAEISRADNHTLVGYQRVMAEQSREYHHYVYCAGTQWSNYGC